jgi:hypothetical protein
MAQGKTYNSFFPTKNVLKKFGGCYFLASLCLFVGILMLRGYQRYGYINIGKVGADFFVYGKAAVITIWGILGGSLLLSLYCVFQTAKTIVMVRRNDIREAIPPPHFIICIKCEKSFRSEALNGFRCPECGGELEDLRGFYEKHPEFKEKNGQAISGKRRGFLLYSEKILLRPIALLFIVIICAVLGAALTVWIALLLF